MHVVVGIGSNLGDRLANLRDARRRIGDIAEVVATSRVYETHPVGGPPQAAFLNAALLVVWRADPLELLDALQRVESELGRIRDVRWGPRTIDLDVLWTDRGEIDDPRLVVPHPRLAERVFALRPLLDVCAHATDPRTGTAYEDVLAARADRDDAARPLGPAVSLEAPRSR